MNCLALLESGIDSWNQWRAAHPDEPCDLTGADLSEGYFFEGNFQGVVLKGAKLRRACLIGADFRSADLSEADLSGAYLGDATLCGANLSNANLKEANLNQADLRQTNLLKSQISEANVYKAQLPNFGELTAEPQLKPATPALPLASETLDPAFQFAPAEPAQLKQQPPKKRLAGIAASFAIALGIPLMLYSFASNRGTVSFGGNRQVASQPSAAQYALAQSLSSDAQVWAVATYVQANRDPVVVSGGANGLIDIWHKETGELIHRLSGHADTVRSLAISVSGQRLVSSSGDGIKVWQPETGELIYSIPAEQIDPVGSPVWSVAISPDERTFISSNYDGTITLWQLETGEPIYSVYVDSTVWSVAIAPDGKSFVGGSSDRAIRQWNLATGELLQTLSGHSDAVRSVAISPDGQTLASGSWDKTIKLWNLTTGELQTTLSGHADRIISLAISADGKTLASGSIDNTLKLWDLSSQELVTTLDNNSNWILSVAFAQLPQTTGQAPNQTPSQTTSQTLVSGGKDQTVKVWQ